MDQFTPQDIADWIGIITVFGALLIVGYHAMVSYCDRQPIYDPLVHGPEDQQEIAAKHVSKRASSQLIGGLLQLDEEPAPETSRPLPVRYHLVEEARRRESAAQRQMAADTIKGKRP